MNLPEHRYRIYRVEGMNYLTLRVVRSFYTYGPATDQDYERELGMEDDGEYVVYPFNACQEFKVVRPTASVTRTVEDGRHV